MTFNVDHSKLDQGIYINNAKVIGDKEVVTYDIRVFRPYRDRLLTNVEMHSIEHIMAAYLEEEFMNISGYERIYFGPMGCQTGFYLVVASPIEETESEKTVLKLIQNACAKALADKKVPFTGSRECGNNRTLEFTRGVECVLNVILHITTGIQKYHYIEDEPVVTTKYTVAFGKTEVVVNTNVLSYDEICELAKDSTPRKFIEELRKAVKERTNS